MSNGNNYKFKVGDIVKITPAFGKALSKCRKAFVDKIKDRELVIHTVIPDIGFLKHRYICMDRESQIILSITGNTMAMSFSDDDLMKVELAKLSSMENSYVMFKPTILRDLKNIDKLKEYVGKKLFVQKYTNYGDIAEIGIVEADTGKSINYDIMSEINIFSDLEFYNEELSKKFIDEVYAKENKSNVNIFVSDNIIKHYNYSSTEINKINQLVLDYLNEYYLNKRDKNTVVDNTTTSLEFTANMIFSKLIDILETNKALNVYSWIPIFKEANAPMDIKPKETIEKTKDDRIRDLNCFFGGISEERAKMRNAASSSFFDLFNILLKEKEKTSSNKLDFNSKHKTSCDCSYCAALKMEALNNMAGSRSAIEKIVDEYQEYQLDRLYIMKLVADNVISKNRTISVSDRNNNVLDIDIYKVQSKPLDKILQERPFGCGFDAVNAITKTVFVTNITYAKTVINDILGQDPLLGLHSDDLDFSVEEFIPNIKNCNFKNDEFFGVVTRYNMNKNK